MIYFRELTPQHMRKTMNIFTLPKRFVLVAILLFFASQPVRADVMKLIPLLTQSLGVSESQAKGGAGVIFDYVKQKVSAGDFAHPKPATYQDRLEVFPRRSVVNPI
jgi:hypothetical protein